MSSPRGTALLERPAGAEGFERVLKGSLEGFKDLCLIKAALEMGVFQRLEKPAALDHFEAELGLDRRLLYLFLENLVRLGLLQKQGEGYALSPSGRAFLAPQSPYCQLRRLRHEIDRALRWLDLPRLLGGGASRYERVPFFGEIIHVLAEQRLLGELQETLEILCGLEGFRQAKRCLDLGGGHGLFAIAYTMVKEDLEVHVLDLPQVLQQAKAYIDRYGAKRVRLLPGDFFRDELGTDYDLVFSAYNPAGKRAEVIPKISRCLKKGGTYVNQQFFPEGDGFFTTEDLDWNLWSFGMKKGFKAYTFEGDLDLSKYLDALRKEGFKVERVIDMKRGDKMIVSQKG